tara:strand:+ start:657 stop:1016 length:360 start_codon:yes stop_codon:yes gene_type:complete
VLFSVTPAIPKMDDNKDKKADKKSAKHKSSGHHKKKSKRDDKLRKAFAGPTKIDINEIELGPKLVRLRISLPLYSKLSLDIYIDIFYLVGVCSPNSYVMSPLDILSYLELSILADLWVL